MKDHVVVSVNEDGFISAHGPYSAAEAASVAAAIVDNDSGQKSIAEVRQLSEYDLTRDGTE